MLPGMAGGVARPYFAGGSMALSGGTVSMSMNRSVFQDRDELQACTISMWLYRDASASNPNGIFIPSCGDINSNDFGYIWYIPDNGKLTIRGSTEDATYPSNPQSYRLETNTGASAPIQTGWNHLVVIYDFDNATEGDRIRVYVDNSRYTDFPQAEFYPDQGTQHGIIDFDDTDIELIGGTLSETTYIADMCVVDEQTLDPDNFGRPGAGGWVWRNYDGSFGQAGYRLHPQDDTEIGTDKSGNGFDFTGVTGITFDEAFVPPT